MSPPTPDPYRTLGIAPDATDDELRTTYRRLAMRHHPDHNGGSPDAAVRFAEIQEAYAHICLARRTATRPASGATDDALEARIAEMEQELAKARAQRERAAHRAERIARVRRGAPRSPSRPSDEDLGYVSTNDSFTKILDDFADHVAGQSSDAHHASRPEPRRTKPKSVADWIDELGGKLTGEDR